MYSISKETYKMMKEDIGDQLENAPMAGMLVPSKLSNYLMWCGQANTAQVREFSNDTTTVPIGRDGDQPSSPNSNCSLDSGQNGQSFTSSSSGCSAIEAPHYDVQQLSHVWDFLASITDDGCELCERMNVPRGHFPTHTLFDVDNKRVTCPLALNDVGRACYQTGNPDEFSAQHVQYASIGAENNINPGHCVGHNNYVSKH